MRRLLLLPLLLAFACADVTNEYPDSLTAPTKATTANKIEFRVFGTNVLTPVTVKHTDPINGITIYQGGVPYFVSIASTEDFTFLFIEAAGSGNTFNSTLQVQIFVNGKLFREAFSQGYTLYASANGTYRK